MTNEKEKNIAKALESAAEHLAEQRVDTLLTKGMVRFQDREAILQKEKKLQAARLQEAIQGSTQKMSEGFLRLEEIARSLPGSEKQNEALKEIQNVMLQLKSLADACMEKIQAGENLDEAFFEEKLGGGFAMSDEIFLTFYEKASHIYQEGSYEEAFLILTALCFIKPVSANLWIARGMAAFQCRLHDDALASYFAIKRMYPDDPKPYPYIIDVLLAQNDKEKAMVEFYALQDLVKKQGLESAWQPTLQNIQRVLK